MATTILKAEDGSDDDEISILCTAPAVFKSGATKADAVAKLTIDLTQDDDEYDVAAEAFRSSSTTKRDDILLSRSFTCEICNADKPLSDSFLILGCGHCHCTRCTSDYVAAKVRENITRINCPTDQCGAYLEPHHCRTILPKAVFERWGDALCEAMIFGEEKLYCPFNDCSAVLIDDGREKLAPTECPECRRLFCVACKAAFHEGMECAEFQKLIRDARTYCR